MRLIDGDAAIDAFDNQTWERIDIPICKEIRNAAKETIRQLPTIDAVPVIRCKDCKFHHDRTQCKKRIGTWFDDDYCNGAVRAERKEE